MGREGRSPFSCASSDPIIGSVSHPVDNRPSHPILLAAKLESEPLFAFAPPAMPESVIKANAVLVRENLVILPLLSRPVGWNDWEGVKRGWEVYSHNHTSFRQACRVCRVEIQSWALKRAGLPSLKLSTSSL
jgi:hypothetical protein